MPSSSKGWLHSWCSPVSCRVGRGAAHVHRGGLSPYVKEPERVSKQPQGIREESLCPSSRSMTQEVTVFPRTVFRLIPYVSSEAAGSPALLPYPLSKVSISKTVPRLNM